MKEYSKTAWGIASQYSGVLASETRDLAAQIDAALLAERKRCAGVARRWKSPLKPGTEARLLGHKEAAREIAKGILGAGQG